MTSFMQYSKCHPSCEGSVAVASWTTPAASHHTHWSMTTPSSWPAELSGAPEESP